MKQKEHLSQPVLTIASKNFITLYENFTIQQALDDIRLRKVGDRIVYFYVVDSHDHLVGVVPTRRLLTAPLAHRLSEVMIGEVMTIPQSARILDAWALFTKHKFLAFPIVDEQRHILGVIDVGQLKDVVFNFEEGNNFRI
jgi:Mg/Co/Ni transporter MgtE